MRSLSRDYDMSPVLRRGDAFMKFIARATSIRVTCSLWHIIEMCSCLCVSVTSWRRMEGV